jgi:hypothetical protein
VIVSVVGWEKSDWRSGALTSQDISETVYVVGKFEHVRDVLSAEDEEEDVEVRYFERELLHAEEV